MAKRNVLLAGVIMIILSYLPVFFLSNDTLRFLTIEDGFYESVTAWLFLAATIVFLYAFVRARPRNVFFLLFVLAFFFAAGEEISWGQRIFHFATPASFEANNAQEEFNIHNLNFIQHETGIGTSLLGMILNFNRLFMLFCVLYTILIPLANTYSAGLRSQFSRLRIPIVSAWFGALFVFNEIVCKALELYVISCQSNCPDVYEIKEAVWSLLALLWGIYFLSAHAVASEAATPAELSPATGLPGGTG